MCDPLSNKIVCFLCDLGGGGLAGADGPDRLVRDDHLGPVFDRVLDRVELHFEDVVGVARLPLLQVLAHTHDRSDALLLAPLQLLCYDLVRLLEMLSPLTVTHQGPMHTEILHLLCLHFSGLSTLVCCCYILYSYLNV